MTSNRCESKGVIGSGHWVRCVLSENHAGEHIGESTVTRPGSVERFAWCGPRGFRARLVTGELASRHTGDAKHG